MKEFVFEKYHLHYDLFCPAQTQGRKPLVLCLPDTGADDFSLFTSERVQAENPSYVLQPVLPEGFQWSDPDIAYTLSMLLYSLSDELPIDRCRIYAVGSGAGAAGVWRLLSRAPRLLAAGIALSGCGDPYEVRNAKFVPVWAFHAQDDTEVDVSGPCVLNGRQYLAGSRRLVEALRTAGGELVQYREFPAGSVSNPHSLWKEVFSDGQMIRWMFEQNRRKVFMVYYIRPGVWRIDDYFASSCYLLEGPDRALLIDTGLGEGDFVGLIRSLTRLPVEVAITHPHRDHAFHANRFDRVWMHENDIGNLEEINASLQDRSRIDTPYFNRFQWPELKKDSLLPIRDGSIITLGEGAKVEVMELAGHTPNSVIFLDHYHKMVFTGDAIGSGYVVGIRFKSSEQTAVFTAYRNAVMRLKERLPELKDYVWFGGHAIQENSCDSREQESYLSGRSHYFVPLSGEVVEDMVAVCDKILSEGKTIQNDPKTGEYYIPVGSAAIAGVVLEG